MKREPEHQEHNERGATMGHNRSAVRSCGNKETRNIQKSPTICKMHRCVRESRKHQKMEEPWIGIDPEAVRPCEKTKKRNIRKAPAIICKTHRGFRKPKSESGGTWVIIDRHQEPSPLRRPGLFSYVAIHSRSLSWLRPNNRGLCPDGDSAGTVGSCNGPGSGRRDITVR